VRTNVDPRALLVPSVRTWKFFVAPYIELSKIFIRVHIYNIYGKTIWYIFFFHLASKWCAQTLHSFSQILKIFSCIGAPVVAPSSDNFQICLSAGKGFSSRKKAANYRLSKSAYNHRRYLLSLWKKEWKHHTSSYHADVRHSISTKFCTMIEVVRAIISPSNFFGSRQ